MKKLHVKILSCVLTAAMVLPFAACNKKNGDDREKSHSGQQISADSPWFTSKTLKVKPKIDTKKTIDYTAERFAGIYKDSLAVYTTGYYKLPTGNINWETFNSSEYMINVITIIDKNTGETTNTIDLAKYLEKNGYIDSVTFEEGVIKARISRYDEKTQSSKTIEYKLDSTSGKELDKHESSSDVQDINFERVFRFGKYVVRATMGWDENNIAYYVLHFFEGDEETIQLDLKGDGVNVYNIPLLLYVGDDLVLAPAISDNNSNIYFEINMKDFSTKTVDPGKYPWVKINDINKTFPMDDGKVVYYSDYRGVSKIDANTKKTEEVFNYSWCDVNRSTLLYLDLVSCDEKNIVFCGEMYTPGYNNSKNSEYLMITFERASTNPHAGKTLIELYSSYGYVDLTVGEAIKKFNDTNGSYFIDVCDRYKGADNVDFTKINSSDDYENASLKSNANMSNELAMDILNGEGPDILMNTSSFGQLNTSAYLVDLNKYVGELSSDKYFTNVIKASENDGKLYQLPICFMITGIHTDTKYAGKSGVGFTTSEYEEFLKKTLNGKDLMDLGQAAYFTRLFTAMSDKFIVNGKVDLSGPEFAELAEFVKNNVPEKSKSYDEYNGSTETEGAAYAVGAMLFKGDTNECDAVYSSCYGTGGYLCGIAQTKGGTAFLGLPSTDGRGPMIESYMSIAISAQSKYADACGEFVKMLISDEVQTELANADNLVLNRKAFRDGAKLAVEYYNGDGGTGLFGYDSTGNPIRKIIFSDKHVDELEKIIMSCSRMNSADAAINLILIEEMPAYFSGQKDLKSVVTIAQDRAQKVVSERG